MRTLILCIFFFSQTSPSPQVKIISQEFSIQNFATALITQLDGDADVVYWDNDNILVQTSVQSISSHTSAYSLDYMIGKGFFELDCCLIDDAKTLLLKSKKINNSIFYRGQKQKTKQVFKIFIPKRLQYSIQ
ncbi:MAG TPA: hypothetical protein ENJ53_00520 [Phaeodactylibacter sp.]|nr:hypothetical protein [Phaeodactylibacter sp.]